MKSLRYCFLLHTIAPIQFALGYLLIGVVSWVVVSTGGTKVNAKFMTNPQTAEEFTQRCYVYLQKNEGYKAFKDCDRATTLDPSSYKAFFGRSSARRRLHDKAGARQDYWHARQLKMERNRKGP